MQAIVLYQTSGLQTQSSSLADAVRPNAFFSRPFPFFIPKATDLAALREKVATCVGTVVATTSCHGLESVSEHLAYPHASTDSIKSLNLYRGLNGTISSAIVKTTMLPSESTMVSVVGNEFLAAGAAGGAEGVIVGPIEGAKSAVKAGSRYAEFFKHFFAEKNIRSNTINMARSCGICSSYNLAFLSFNKGIKSIAGDNSEGLATVGSAIGASMTTQPAYVAQLRSEKGESVYQTAKRMIKTEGLKALFKGALPRALHTGLLAAGIWGIASLANGSNAYLQNHAIVTDYQESVASDPDSRI